MNLFIDKPVILTLHIDIFQRLCYNKREITAIYYDIR